MKSIEAGKWKNIKSKLPYLVLPLCHLYNYNLGIYMEKNQFVCYCLSLIHI